MRQKVKLNSPLVLSLFVLTIGQTVIYTIIYEPKFLLRHMAMMGALMILLAEHQGKCTIVINQLLSRLVRWRRAKKEERKTRSTSFNRRHAGQLSSAFWSHLPHSVILHFTSLLESKQSR